MKKYLDAQSAANPINALMNAFYESDVVKRATQEQKIYNGEIEETNTVIGKVEKGLKALTESQEEYGDVLSQYGSQRVKQFKDELVNFQLEIDFKDDDYGKAIAELDLWRKRELEDKNFVTQGERDAINELYEARKALIDSEVGGLSSKIITHENMPSKRTSGLTYDLNDIAKFYNYTGYSQISRTGFVFR